MDSVATTSVSLGWYDVYNEIQLYLCVHKHIDARVCICLYIHVELYQIAYIYTIIYTRTY